MKAAYRLPWLSQGGWLVMHLGTLVTVFLVGACVPANPRHINDPTTENGDLSAIRNDRPSLSSLFPARKSRSNAQERSRISAIDSQSYRIDMSRSEVWDAILDSLMRNYNLNVVDQSSGVITTEWDTFFLNNQLYRNKVSVRLKSLGRYAVELSIRNNVQRHSEVPGKSATLTSLWLPEDDVASEGRRLIQSIAVLLDQPLPNLPPSATAAGEASKNR